MSHKTFAILSIFTALIVVIGSLHAAQAIGATVSSAHDVSKKVANDDGSTLKLVSDLHHHSDKSGSQLIKDIGEQQLYADNRSLRLARHKKSPMFRKVVLRWQRAVAVLQI